MPNKQMKTLTVGGETYDIVDPIARGRADGFSDDAKQALLTLLEHVAYTDENGQTYLDALETALTTKVVTSIVAVFTQGQAVIYDNASLDDLKQYLVVTANYDDGSSAEVESYTLSGTLEVGTSTIAATYSGKTDTFEVTVTAAPTLESISAVYTQSGTVYTTDTLDSLKSDLVVTANYDDSSTATIPGTDYTLSGTLAEGTSTITVLYGGEIDTFTVTVTLLDNSIYNWDFTQSLIDSKQGTVAVLGGSATQDSNGLHIPNATSFLDLGTGILASNQSYEIDIADMDVSSWTSGHGRVFIWYQSTGQGLVYHSTGTWAVYAGSWKDASPTVSDKEYFKNSTLKIKVEPSTSESKVTIYKDGVEVFSVTDVNSNVITNSSHVYLGGGGGISAFSMTITGFRVYSEV